MLLARLHKPNPFDPGRREPFTRVVRVALACLCTIGLAACELMRPPAEGGDRYVQGNVFDDAIWKTTGSGGAVIGRLAENVAGALTDKPSVDAVTALLRRHGARCERHGRHVACGYQKTRLGGKTISILTRYAFEVVVRPGKSGKTALVACVDGDVHRACVEKEL